MNRLVELRSTELSLRRGSDKESGRATGPISVSGGAGGGAEAEVVIPRDLRDELKIEQGDMVSFWRHGDRVALRVAGR